jgi:hypothetical protein
MNIFTDVVFIFVFVFVILHFGIINIRETNVVWQKLLMFLAVTMFTFLLYAMKSVRRQQTVKPWDVINGALFVGLLTFIGHTIMFDMLYTQETQKWVTSFTDGKYLTVNVLLAFYICASILIGKSIGYIFNTNACIN